MTAIQLTDTVWLVGTPEESHPAYTSRFDCNQYLVTQGSDAFLVDAGTGIGAASWLENVAEVRPLNDLQGVIITHYHADHAGGAGAAARAGIPVLGSPETAAALKVGDEETTQLAQARMAGIYPESLFAESVPTALPLAEHQAFNLGDGILRILWSPGHCDGHLVVEHVNRTESVLFTGDVIFSGGRISMQALPDCRLDRYAATILQLSSLKATAMFPGHGPHVAEKAYRDIDRADASFRMLVPPPNLLPSPGFGTITATGQVHPSPKNE